MSMPPKRRGPLVLASTAAAVDAVLRNCTPSTGCSWTTSKADEIESARSCATAAAAASTAGEVEDENGGSGVVILRAGLLLWQGVMTGDAASVQHEMLESRHAGRELGIFDETTTVGVSASVLRRLCLPSGSWVTVKDTSTSLMKPARVMVLDPPENIVSKSSEQDGDSMSRGFPVYRLWSGNRQVDPAVSFLSPVLAFNLGIHVSWLEYLTSYGLHLDEASKSTLSQDSSCGLSGLPMCVTGFGTQHVFVEMAPFLPVLERSLPNNTNGDKMILRIKSHVYSCRVTYAAHMQIGLIRVPMQNPALPPLRHFQTRMDASLQEYFKTDRFLARGDVFSVQLGPSSSPLQLHSIDHSQSSGKFTKQEFLFFKVLALEPTTETILCSKYNYTALVLGGPMAAQLPPLARSSHLHAHFLRTLAVQQLESLLAPCLHPRVLPLQLRLSVLLHGPSGSGKQTVVRLAAEDLGMHVVEHNCYELIGATEAKTAAAVMNTFKSAKRYSPSVLLLRYFDALGKSLPAGSPPGHTSGGPSRVMSILKACITAHLPSTDNTSCYVELSDVDNESSCSTPMKVAGIGHEPRNGLVLVVGTCDRAENLLPELRRCFTHEVAIDLPTEEQRLSLLHHYLGLRGHQNVGRQNILDERVEASIKIIAAQSSGLTPRDLRAVAADAGAVAIIQCGKDGQWVQNEYPSSISKHLTDLEMNGKLSQSHLERQSPVRVSAEHLETVLDRVKLRTASAIGTPKVPNVKWEDVGGLEDVKKAILDTVQLPLVHRELFSSGLRQRSGVLLYGPPGTGKTLLAKAVATECSLNFLSVKGPELINMYIGESEKNVREIFHKARTARPCVVFFDELDALAPARGASGDSGGVMDRVVSQMLAEIDGVSENSQDLFIIGASNRPDLIDPALLRPGRFDKLLYVGVSSENSFRERVLQALTRKFHLDNNVSLNAIAQRCPVTYTGADMYALCADAWHQAVKREISKLDRRKTSSNISNVDKVVVKEEDFSKAMGELVPSLSPAELNRYERLRFQFEGKQFQPSFPGKA